MKILSQKSTYASRPEARPESEKCIICGSTEKPTYHTRFNRGIRCADCIFERPRRRDLLKPEPEPITPQILYRSVFKVLRCFGCDGPIGMKTLSKYPLLCNDCLETARRSATVRGNRFIEKTMRKVEAFMRGRL